MSRKLRFAPLLLLTLSMLGVAINPATAGSPTAAPAGARAASFSNLTIVNFNASAAPGAFTQAITTAKNQGAYGITLQEVCRKWINDLDAAEDWTIAFHARRTGVQACPGDTPAQKAIGEAAIYTRPDATVALPVSLMVDGPDPTQSGQDYQLTCVKFEGAIVHRVCTTHLTVYSTLVPPNVNPNDIRDYRAKQIQAVANYGGNRIVDDENVAITGDLNSQPSETMMNPLYASGYGSGSTGQFQEIDKCLCRGNPAAGNRATENNSADPPRKLDYIFWSRNRASGAAADRDYTLAAHPGSEHYIMIGTMRINVTP